MSESDEVIARSRLLLSPKGNLIAQFRLRHIDYEQCGFDPESNYLVFSPRSLSRTVGSSVGIRSGTQDGTNSNIPRRPK